MDKITSRAGAVPLSSSGVSREIRTPAGSFFFKRGSLCIKKMGGASPLPCSLTEINPLLAPPPPLGPWLLEKSTKYDKCLVFFLFLKPSQARPQPEFACSFIMRLASQAPPGCASLGLCSQPKAPGSWLLGGCLLLAISQPPQSAPKS